MMKKVSKEISADEKFAKILLISPKEKNSRHCFPLQQFWA